MKKFLTLLLTCSLVVSLANISFNAADETATIVQKSRAANMTIGDTSTDTETSTDIYAMSANISGNDVSMYPIISIGNAGTYAKTYLPEGMSSTELTKLISFAKEQGFAKINSGTGAVGEEALIDADDLDIAITTAIWGKYRYNMGDSTKYIDFDRNASSKYVKAAKYIINNYSSYTIPQTTFDVNSSNIKTIAHTDADYKYYGPFNFTSNNSSIAVAEVPSGVQIANSNWSVVDANNLSAGTNYYIAVPTNSQSANITVKLALQYVEKDIVVYGNSAAKFVGLINSPFKLNETLTISSYATAKIYDTAGNVVNVRSDDGVYDKNIVIGTNGVGYAENLTIGNYTAKQVSTAEGLILNTTPKTFSITSTSDIVDIRFDTVSLYGNLQIRNISNAGKTLNGGTLSIYCTDGTLYKTVTMQDTVSIAMPIGNYTAVQSTAVNGYVLDTSTHSFTVNPNKLTELTIVNVPVGYTEDSTNAHQGNGKITVLSKKDGIVTNVYDIVLSGNGVTLKGSPIEGTVQFTGLKVGSYNVYMSNLPTEYTEASAVVLLTTDDASETVTLNTTKKSNVENRTLGIIAVDENNYVIPNVSFDIYSKDTGSLVGTITTDSNGYGKLSNFAKGYYRITPRVNSDKYDNSDFNLEMFWDNGIIAKIVLLRADDNVTTSYRLPSFASDIVLDNHDTGVNNNVYVNNYNRDDSVQIIDGEKYYIVEDDEDYDGRVRIIVENPKGRTMSDVSISVYNDKDKKLFTGDTNEDGELLLTGLEPKKDYHITLKSSTLDDYYAPAEDDLIFSTKSDKTTKFVVSLLDEEYTESKVEESSLVITTQNKNGEKIYAEYTVYNAAGQAVVSGKTVNGVATFNTSDPGTYTVKQTKVQDGYTLEQEPYTFTITETPRTVAVTVTNEQGTGKLTLTGRIFADKNGNNLYDNGEGYRAGKVTISNGEKAVSVFSDATGSFTVTDLPAGTYTVQAELGNVQYVQKGTGTNKTIDSDVDSTGKGTVTLTTQNVTDFGIGIKYTQTGSSTNTGSSNSSGSTTTLPKTGDFHTDNTKYIMLSAMCLVGIIVLNRKAIKR